MWTGFVPLLATDEGILVHLAPTYDLRPKIGERKRNKDYVTEAIDCRIRHRLDCSKLPQRPAQRVSTRLVLIADHRVAQGSPRTPRLPQSCPAGVPLSFRSVPCLA